MARPFTYISSQTYYDLEIYFFRLAMYTDSEEYSKLRHKQRNKIDREILWLDSMLHLMQMFRVRDVTETPVMAWKKKLDEGETHRLFRFSSVTTAGRCLDVPSTKVTAVARGTRPTAGGYIFQYEKDYNQEEERNADVVGKKKKGHTKEFLEFIITRNKQRQKKDE